MNFDESPITHQYSLLQVVNMYLEQLDCSTICDETLNEVFRLVLDNKFVPAIKLLRQNSVNVRIMLDVRSQYNNKFADFLRNKYCDIVVRRTLGLKEAKDIIDYLRDNQTLFDGTVFLKED